MYLTESSKAGWALGGGGWKKEGDIRTWGEEGWEEGTLELVMVTKGREREEVEGDIFWERKEEREGDVEVVRLREGWGACLKGAEVGEGEEEGEGQELVLPR
jgi:hypothetical protein